jgi:hypothetical protein
MRKIVNNLKERPEHHRQLVAFSVSATIVGIMAVIWATTLPVRFAQLTEKTADAQQATGLEAIMQDEIQYTSDTVPAPTVTESAPEPENDVIISDTAEEIEGEPYFNTAE